MVYRVFAEMDGTGSVRDTFISTDKPRHCPNCVQVAQFQCHDIAFGFAQDYRRNNGRDENGRKLTKAYYLRIW